jgi:hypothetical protein
LGGNFSAEPEAASVGDSISETRAGAAETSQTLDMLAAFVSVGVRRFDLTLTDVAGDKVRFRAGCSLDQLRFSLAHLLSDSGATA